MKHAMKVYMSLLALSTILLAGSVVIANKAASGTADRAASEVMPEQSKSPKNPCWFMTLEGLKDESITYEMIKEREDRDMHGYPREIPLSEAIKIFNEEKQCYRYLETYPALTEEEVIAAIVAGPDDGKRGAVWRAQKDALWKIASEKVMPKGSLLMHSSGPLIQESPLRPSGTIAAQGITITLFLGLEHQEHGVLVKPEQTLIIRKTYSGIKTVR